jgi:tRNA modification GTPase
MVTRDDGSAPTLNVGGGPSARGAVVADPSPATTPHPAHPGAALPGAADTIVALATVPGRSAIAVIRLSGPAAFAVAGSVLRPWPTPAREARLVAAHDPNTGELLDRPLVTRFEPGRSYTGEALVEIATHGGYVAPAAVLAALVAAGAREALPGEFTRRAVLNGKLDVVQAEAIGDLIDARSHAMQRAALAQLEGGLSRRVARLREQILEVEALLAYDIDFPEEDDGPVPLARIAAASRAVVAALDALLATAPAGELVREGAVVVIAGAPNAGKSSLFNALLGQSRAIVTAVPGTTRDALEAVVDAGSWPLRLVDTAGLRATEDVVERLGIEVSERYLARAQVVLACGESAAAVAECVARVRSLTEAPIVPVRTKADLDGPPPGAAGTAPSPAPGPAAVAVSAETGAGLPALLRAVVDALASRYGAPSAEFPLVTRARHRRALEEARGEMAQFERSWGSGELPAVVAAVHVRAAAGALEELIGAVDVDDVLDRVFSTFCVGK